MRVSAEWESGEAVEPERSARREAALAGHTGDVETARRHLGDSDPEVRATALGALQRAGDLRPEELEKALIDSAAAVRQRAAELIAELPGDQPPSLLALLEDPEPSVVEAAAWACGERTPPEPGVVPCLAQLTTGHDEPLCREAAVAALGAIGDDGGLEAILEATQDRPAIRRRAVLALAVFAGPEVDAALERARRDRDWQVRQAAEDVSG